MKDWPIFSGADGFGGNGPWIPELPPYIWLAVPVRSGGGCVPDGPFTIDKFSLSLGPSHNTSLSNPHCLTRDFSPEIATYNLNKATWDAVLEQSDYGRFGKRLEAEPNFVTTNIHGGGHFAIGGSLGSMGDSYLSPGDPLFWLHHNNLERLFVSWQKKDLKRRLKDVSGPIYAFDFANQRGGNVTLGFEVNLGPLGGSRSLGSLMEVGKKELCYEF